MELVFKCSFDKANRTSLGAFRGPGMQDGLQAREHSRVSACPGANACSLACMDGHTRLQVLQAVRTAFDVPIVTDIHEPWQAAPVACVPHLVSLVPHDAPSAHCAFAARRRVADVLQIPAFLCRQTDLLSAAGATRAVVHLKKGQWCAPEVATAAAAKLHAAGAAGVVLCERGTQHGYHDLIVDVRNLEEMRARHGARACLLSADVTHALQRPCGLSGPAGPASGGARHLVPCVARACAAAGADGIFLEVHDAPCAAPVDAPTQWPLRALRPLLRELRHIAAASRARRRGGREPDLTPAGEDWTPTDDEEGEGEGDDDDSAW
jgi:2-dehydro-3-deoxyphosphooctonate aldolase (KDO 8-P synthase)